jgi:hypothetical protein
MRVIPFREVLWGVANKMGLDPLQSNFLENQAIPIGDSIDQWVRRTYDAKDWPEWVVTDQFTPTAHVVAWDYVGSGVLGTTPKKLGRVIKVFLVDPSTTNAPIDTPFTLTPAGVHCGYEHGSAVWIRYILPPPKFTAAQWAADTTYQVNDVAYSYTTGEVYRSKASNNIGHDPAVSFTVPPNPVILPVPMVPPPTTEVTQEFTPNNPGLAQRNQITVVTFVSNSDDVPLPDPPLAGTNLYVSVYDNPPNTLLGDSLHVATGAESVAAIITAMRTVLAAQPGLSTFTITADTTAKTITFNNASAFVCAQSFFQFTDGITHLMRSVDTQTYIPLFAAASGQAQITRVTITPDTTHPGAVYELHVIGSDGTDHAVEYASALSDSSVQIFQGLILATETSTDTFWGSVVLSFDPTGITLDIAVRDRFSVTPITRPAPGQGQWWELVPFPKALADQVMRGGYADLLKEWGQTDKGLTEEQAVPVEDGVATSKFASMPDPPLTGQERGLSRYRLQS